MSGLSDRVVDHLRAVAREAGVPDLSSTRYTLVRWIDHGGMGTVYLVADRTLGRPAALKVLHLPDPSGEMSARLLHEARLVARLEHPNIVPVHDAGTLPDGRVYYVMKYVRGKRLDEWRGEGPTRPAMLRLFQRVCHAVAFAHSQGVIHRDLKPENVMVGTFGEALVLDWGVAKAIGRPKEDAETAPAGPEGVDTAGALTAKGVIVGTPSYMAPEQARGDSDRLDARADVWALGAILYYLLCGRPPFEGSSAAEILRRVAAERPVPPRKRDPAIPKALQSMCMKAMAPEPEDRYRSAHEMAEDVDRYLDGLQVTAHSETLGEKLVRVISNHRALALLVVAYLVMRAVMFFLART